MSRGEHAQSALSRLLAQRVQRGVLDLPDPLCTDAEPLPELSKRALPSVKPEPRPHDGALALGEHLEQCRQLLDGERRGHQITGVIHVWVSQHVGEGLPAVAAHGLVKPESGSVRGPKAPDLRARQPGFARHC